MKRSQMRPSSSSEGATLAPLRAIALVAALRISNTQTSNLPALSTCPAIGSPISPQPTKPTFIMIPIPLAMAGPKCRLFRTRRIAEPRDDLAPRDRVERERVHVMIGADILAQRRVIGVEHVLGRRHADLVVLHIAAGMKQQRRARRDADVADRQEYRARRLAVLVDAEALAGGIVLRHHRVEPA